MKLSLSMNFSNFSSAFETLLENNNAELNVFAISKFSVIEKVDKFSINLS